MEHPEFDKAMTRARVDLMRKNNTIFFSALCLGLKHIADGSIPTACTDGITIKYNPTWFLELTRGARVGLMLHEVLHVAFKHVERTGKRTAYRANVAADHVVNNVVDEANIELPPNPILDKKYVDWTFEAVYADLPEDIKMDAAAMDLKPNDDPKNSKDNKLSQTVEMEIDNLLVKANIMAQQNSNDYAAEVPNGLKRYIDTLLAPRIPWKKHLRNFARTIARDDYSFKMPNRRYFPGAYLPSLRSEKFGSSLIGFDISGSITDKQFNEGVSEIAHIIRTLNPEYIDIIQFTHHLEKEDRVKSLRNLKNLNMGQSGGTQITPVLKRAQELKPRVLIIFTDGYFEEITINPKIPTLWIINDNPTFTAPFGKVVHYGT